MNQKQKESLTSLKPLATQATSDLPKAWIVELFNVLIVKYPNKFVCGIDGVEQQSVNDWAHVLSGCSRADIHRGLEQLPECWPPNAIDFLKLCRHRKKCTVPKQSCSKYYKKIRSQAIGKARVWDENRKRAGLLGIETLKAALKQSENKN